ncbi:DUF1891 domain-containing protein, partial [Salmonella sp. gx-f7]|uniref:alkylated DNA repair protein domain-containing protein n=1 Tax=Salmonella sp. gx-f7 TaxID=2582606 RepID=UPI001D1CBB40
SVNPRKAAGPDGIPSKVLQARADQLTEVFTKMPTGMRSTGWILISDDLSWSANTRASLKKAQQRLHFLRVLRRNNLEKKLLVA